MTSDPSVLDQIRSHMEFLGYTVNLSEGDDPALMAEHETELNCMVKAVGGGIMMMSLVSCSDYGRESPNEFLQAVNQLNREAVIGRFYLDEDSDLRVEFWFPEMYEKATFAHLMELWKRDHQLIVRNEAVMKCLG